MKLPGRTTAKSMNNKYV